MDPSMPDPWVISKREQTKYEEMFQKLTPDGYLGGKRAVALLGKSGLPQQTLARVWSLADGDADGRLSVKEFCAAMHLIGCVRKGVPLPELPTRTAKKKLKNSKIRPPPTAAAKPEGVERNKGPIEAAKSPKRRSRLASLVESPDGDGPRTDIPESNEPGIDEISDGGHQDSSGCNQPAVPVSHQNEHVKEPMRHEMLSTASPDKGPHRASEGSTETRGETAGGVIVENGAIRAADESFQTSQNRAAESRDHGAPHRKRRLKLRQLDAKDVDAVFAEDPGAINSLRDVQSWRVLVMGLQRLSDKDMARRVPVKVRPQRRHTLPLATHGELAYKEEFLPGRGRRTSLFGSAYEPAALFLKKRAERGSACEVELEKDIAKAAEKWNLKPLVESADRGASGATDAEQEHGSRGNLSVAGLPLLDEDIDVIAHLLRQNHAFNKLDLSRCFLSEKQFVSLAQALAWNSRVEELYLQECVFTDAGTAAIADVLIVNNHIHAIDVRGCKGLDEKGIQQILRAARKKANLLTFNGMELAVLRAEGSDKLDLSGWGLGYVEAVVVADCLRTRADGLETVDLHNNFLSTLSVVSMFSLCEAENSNPAKGGSLRDREAFTTLMAALLKQSQLRSLDLSHNTIDERTLPQVEELLRRNSRLANVNLTDNRISCTEFEHYGLGLMKLLSSNNTVTVFDIEKNNVSSKMLTIIAEKLAANRAVRRDMTFVDCLHLKYPRIAPRPVLADPRRLHLEVADGPFMAQEGIPAMRTTVRTEQTAILTVNGIKPGIPFDLFFVHQCGVEGTR